MTTIHTANVRAAVALAASTATHEEALRIVAGDIGHVADHHGFDDPVRLDIRRTAEGLRVELYGYATRADALRLAAEYLGRPVTFVRETDTFGDMLASCLVEVA